jgi:hypothetical protein
MRALILTIFLLACNPVKQVMKDPKKFDKVKEAVIRGGYCVTDTVTVETVKDSIVYKDSIIESKVTVPCPDFTVNQPDGTYVASSSGVLTVKKPVKTKSNEKIIKVTNNIKDKSLEAILKKDIADRDSAIKAYVNLYEKSQFEIKALKAEKSAIRWKLIAVIAIAGIVTFRKQILALKWI